MGVNFFLKKCQTGGGGVRGEFGKRPHFFRFFFVHPSLSLFKCFLRVNYLTFCNSENIQEKMSKLHREQTWKCRRVYVWCTFEGVSPVSLCPIHKVLWGGGNIVKKLNYCTPLHIQKKLQNGTFNMYVGAYPPRHPCSHFTSRVPLGQVFGTLMVRLRPSRFAMSYRISSLIGSTSPLDTSFRFLWCCFWFVCHLFALFGTKSQL